jgi:hypothetical protein
MNGTIEEPDFFIVVPTYKTSETQIETALHF